MALDLITPVSDVFRRDYDSSEDAVTGFLKPGTATSLKAGEWLQLNSSGQVKRVVIASSSNTAAVFSADARIPGVLMQSFSQEGDYAVQALSKVCCIQLHNYEAETTMYSSSASTADGYISGGQADSAYVVGGALGLTKTADGKIVLMALPDPVTPGQWVVGHITKVPSAGKLRFQKCTPYLHTVS